MNIDDCFPSKYIRASDLGGRAYVRTIRQVTSEDVGDGMKPVVFFDSGRGLVLNKTNASAIRDVLGAETDDWLGKLIVIFPAKTDYRGRMVDCIRVRIDPPQQQPAPQHSEPVDANRAPASQRPPAESAHDFNHQPDDCQF